MKTLCRLVAAAVVLTVGTVVIAAPDAGAQTGDVTREAYSTINFSPPITTPQMVTGTSSSTELFRACRSAVA